jgi:hypothetical protein
MRERERESEREERVRERREEREIGKDMEIHTEGDRCIHI